MLPASTAWVEQRKGCEELRPKPKEKVCIRGKEEREYQASNRVVCGSKWVSMYEMRKKKQQYEDARKMCRTEIPDKKLGKAKEDDSWEAMIWSEELTDMEKS